MSAEASYLTVSEVAELLGLHPESVRKMVREGRLPAFKAGRSWRFERAEVEAWLRQRSHSGPGPSRILVVDDAPHVREVIRLTLEEAGHEVVLVDSGEGAVAALAQGLPELVLLDLKLPRGSGVEVLRELRHRSAEVPVIVVTGFPDGELMHRALAYSPFTVLAKPVHPEALLHTVHQTLGVAGMGRSRATPSPTPSEPRTCGVLVVDDEPAVRKVLRRMLVRFGCHCVTAAGGREGLERVAARCPDLILLDLMMPEMNGVAFLAALREQQPDLPVVLVTGHPDSVLVREAMEYPPILLLPKPVDEVALARTARAVLGQRIPGRHGASPGAAK